MKKPSSKGMQDGTQVVPRNASSSSNIIGILDAISTDMQVAVLVAENISNGSTPNMMWTGSLLACPGGQNTTCPKEEMRMTIPDSTMFYPNGSGVDAPGPGAFLAPVAMSLINFFVALQDAYQYVYKSFSVTLNATKVLSALTSETSSHPTYI
jgi:hypothetical protein